MTSAIEAIKREDLPVIIFGAGVVGEVLLQAAIDSGVKIECFCDNNINKSKTMISHTRVIHTSSLKDNYQQAVFLISAADIKDVVDQLESFAYTKWHPASLLLREFDYSRFRFSAPIDFVEYAVSTCLLCQDSYLTPDKLFLRSVDIVITERCSLKCRDCSNLMQYYQDPQDDQLTELIKSIDAFCSIVDEVNEFRVIGGEPFMNKEFDMIVKKLTEEPKVKRVVIYTNGTILPSDDKFECLRSNKVLVLITDYGSLSKNLDRLIIKLADNKIAYYIYRISGWTDCSKISRHKRSVEEERQLFKNCCAKNTFTLSKGRLYRCPFSANAARLMAIPDYKADYVDILRESGNHEETNQLKKKIRGLISERDFLEACDYCNGRSFTDSEIGIAVQIDKPLEYKVQNAKL